MIGTIIFDFLHLLATAIWVGGMLYINFVLTPSLVAIDSPQRGKLIGAVSKRFSMFAWGCIIILLMTGLLLTPSGMLFDTTSTWGIMLFIKIILFLIMIIIGTIISFVKAPKMEKLAPKPDEKPAPEFFKIQKQISLLAHINMILGVLILLCVAIQ